MAAGTRTTQTTYIIYLNKTKGTHTMQIETAKIKRKKNTVIDKMGKKTEKYYGS